MTNGPTNLAFVGRSPEIGVGNDEEILNATSFETYPTKELTLADHFPPDDRVPDPFQRVAILEGRGTKRRVPWSDELYIGSNDAYCVYAPAGDEKDLTDPVCCRVSVPVQDEQYSDNLDIHHDAHLWREFEAEPSLEIFTDWVKAELTDETVEGHRRTRHWRRVPIPYSSEWLQEYDLDLPCWELAFAVETVGWGVISVGMMTVPATDERRAERIVETVVDEMGHTARTCAPPKSTRDDLPETEWVALTDPERYRAVRVAAKAPSRRLTDAAWVVKKLDEMYGAPEDEVVELLAEVSPEVDFERLSDSDCCDYFQPPVPNKADIAGRSTDTDRHGGKESQ